ncbi:ATP-binding protein [Nonomuraea sp. NPDC049714]|uniref:ATP-binding protein n=1 Tax=Nonomuraea sp. NPDC049714 TaxID=3364357 RepID=UPI00379D71AB
MRLHPSEPENGVGEFWYHECPAAETIGVLRIRRGAELLFQVITERDERASIAIASNESFSGWTKTFTDPRLCAAIVDRLTYGGNIIETGTVSYRYTQTQAVKSAQQAPS